jgi:hypothetical protein
MDSKVPLVIMCAATFSIMTLIISALSIMIMTLNIMRFSRTTLRTIGFNGDTYKKIIMLY